MRRNSSPPPSGDGDVRVGIDSRKAFAFVIVAQALLMTFAVAFFLHGEGGVHMPPAVDVTTAPVSGLIVPVSYAPAPAAGTTRTAGPALVRGGQAPALAATHAHLGSARNRRTSTARVRHVGDRTSP
jgi:hypothetical protein